MFIQERHQSILQIIENKGRISIGEIQESFGISQDSARRDLRILEEKGLLKRTHGGAIPCTQIGAQLLWKKGPRDVEEVSENFYAIARHAAALIKPNDIVYITSAPIGFLMLRYIDKSMPFTLVTNSVVIADEMKYNENLSIYVIGGKMRPLGHIVDAFATEFVKNMKFDICFISGAGFSADFGLSNASSETIAFQRAVVESTRHKVAIIPSHLIGFNAFLKGFDVNQFDTLITDWDAVSDELERIEEQGLNVIVVDKEK